MSADDTRRSGADGTYWLGQPAAHDPAVVGDVAACLSRLSDLEETLPGFCLTAPPFEALPSGALSPGGGALIRAYRRLCALRDDELVPVAVRSAPIGQRRPAAAWGGAPWTFLNVPGPEALMAAVTECVAPYVSERARAYRAQQGDSDQDVRLAVLIQPFIPADVCASMVTGARCAPTSASTADVIVRSRWGVCDDSGDVAVDTLVLRRSDLEITGRLVAEKTRMLVPGAGGVSEADVPARLQAAASVSDAQARQMARLGLLMEDRLGGPVQAELAVAGRRLYLTWCRPR